MSCGVGHRHCSDPALLWLWCRPVAAAPIQPLAWEPPYAAGAAQEIAKKKKNFRVCIRNGNADLISKVVVIPVSCKWVFSFLHILINPWYCQTLIFSFRAGEMTLYYNILICLFWLPVSLGMSYNFTSYSSVSFYNFPDCIIWTYFKIIWFLFGKVCAVVLLKQILSFDKYI